MGNIINKGDFVTVESYYGNHLEKIFEEFLSNGWTLNNKSAVGNITYLTFEAGANARECKLNLANAHILYKLQ